MIIKKKYTNTKNQEEKILEKEQVVIEKSTPSEKIQNEITEEVVAELKEELKEVEKKDEQTQEKTNKEFDLSIEDIKFEPREERREGTRRKGYRRTQDRNIVTRAQSEAIAIKDAAKQDGYNEGIAKAKEDLAEIKGKLEEFFTYKDKVFEKVSDCILDIAIEISKKIINKEVETDKEVTLSIIKGAVEEINPIENKITLKVMPKEVEIVRDKIPEVFAGTFTEAKISVIPDNSIKEGGVIIETSNGLIDATIETQIAIIEKALNKQEEG